MAIQGASKTSCRAAYEKFGDGDSSNTEAQRRRVDVPFDLPQGWAWCRWKNISLSIQYGYNAPALPKGRIQMVRISDIQVGRIQWEKVPYCEIQESDIGKYLLAPGDILFARTGGTVGKSYLVDDIPHESIYAGYLVRTKSSSMVFPKYTKAFLESNCYWQQLRSGVIATAQPNFNGEKLASMLVPLPPLTEQRRIIAKIEELFAVVDSLGEAADNLESDAKRLDKKILDLAIHGKLVPQDPNDEPASELVKRTAASHKSPCKNQSEPIDPPFAIPQSWEWERLGTICEILDSKRKPVAKSKRKPGPYPYYGATCIQDFVSDFIFDEPLVLLGEDGAKWGKGDKSAFCVDGKIWVNNHAHVLRPCDGINHIYLVCTLDILDLMPYVTGTTVPKLNQEKMCDIQIPLPPLAEQKRIVAKIEELRAVIKPLTM